MTGTLYVVAGRLGGTNDWDEGPRLRLMDADQVRAVAAAGHEVGSHTMTHPRLAGADPAVLAARSATAGGSWRTSCRPRSRLLLPLRELRRRRGRRRPGRRATTTPASPATTTRVTASPCPAATSAPATPPCTWWRGWSGTTSGCARGAEPASHRRHPGPAPRQRARSAGHGPRRCPRTGPGARPSRSGLRSGRRSGLDTTRV